MSALLVVLALVAPLAGLVLAPHRRGRGLALVLAPLPLLALALLGEGAVTATRVLLGLTFAVDAVNRPLLLLAGLGWALAGAVAATRLTPAPARFARFWLLALAGQASLLLAADLAGFYTGYLLMTLAAFGLVVHTGSTEAWRAGRVYLVMALAGEALVLAGVLLLAGHHGNAAWPALAGAVPGLVAWLLFTGFAVKLGLVPLHVWLPLAHPVAPVPASAILSGVLVKAGLLGMLRLLPPGSIEPAVGLLVLGLLTAAWGAIAGLCQGRLKTVLAYSTISQMGLVMTAFAAMQVAGPARTLPVLAVLVLHHGLNKIALFLAAGGQVGASRWRGLLFALPALALAGLPLSTGLLAKEGLKHGLEDAGWSAAAALLSLSSVLTALLLLHAWRLARGDRPEAGTAARAIHPAWPLAVLAGLLVPWLWALHFQGRPGWSVGAVVAGLWPVLLALAIHVLAVRNRWHARMRLPEGDLLAWLEPQVGRWAGYGGTLIDRWLALRPTGVRLWPLTGVLAAIENRLLRLPVAGGLMLVVMVLLAIALHQA